MKRRFALPGFLDHIVTQEAYSRWLHRKAVAHVRRDRKRCDHEVSGARYRELIHAAVRRSNGRDHYTGEPLDWGLIGTYCNEASKAGRSEYKSTLGLLPTADHVPGNDGRYDFVICAWRTNDAKNDLSHDDFVALCRRVVQYHDNAQD